MSPVDSASYTLGVTVPLEYEDTVTATRSALAEQGFGVLTEIDLRATFRAKLDVDVPPQVILGACRPQLAHQALAADPSVAALLPCNVVVRSVDETTTRVEAFDPAVMMGMASTSDQALVDVVTDARDRLTAVLSNLTYVSNHAADPSAGTSQEE